MVDDSDALMGGGRIMGSERLFSVKNAMILLKSLTRIPISCPIKVPFSSNQDYQKIRTVAGGPDSRAIFDTKRVSAVWTISWSYDIFHTMNATRSQYERQVDGPIVRNREIQFDVHEIYLTDLEHAGNESIALGC